MPAKKKLQKKKKLKTTARLEKQLLSQGYKHIIGIDEVGRGAWAGPVIVCGYRFSLESPIFRGITDSKLVKKELRNKYYHKLKKQSHYIGHGEISTINSYGIGKTIELLIDEIIDHFGQTDTYYLIDGQFAKNFGVNTQKVISGDILHHSIAAASIIAKVHRDKIMAQLARKYKGYAFARNVGYPTPTHRKALTEIGICDIHRTSFEPIMRIKQQTTLGI